MIYQWDHIGNQEERLHKRCYMGPVMLEVWEVGWTTSDQATMCCSAYEWDAKELIWTEIYSDPAPKLGVIKGIQFMENWYYENYCFDKDFKLER